MAHVVTDPCVGCKHGDCAVVCPCECFYADDRQYYIDPMDCIDCGACVPECPVAAVFQEDDVPVQWVGAVLLNAEQATRLKAAGSPRVTEKPAG